MLRPNKSETKTFMIQNRTGVKLYSRINMSLKTMLHPNKSET